MLTDVSSQMIRKLPRFISVTSYAANTFLAAYLDAGEWVAAFMTGAPIEKMISDLTL